VSSQPLAYVKDVYKRYRYWPTWTPLTRLSIGDCGTLERGVFFDRKRHVSDFGVSKSALKTKPVPHDPLLLVRSNKGTRIKTQLEADNAVIPGIPEGEAGVRVSFLRENATFLAAVDVSERRLADKYQLEQELIELVRANRFPADYVVITELVRAKAARIFISGEKGQAVSLRARLDTPFGLAGVGAKLSTAFDNSVDLSFDGTRGVTPLFRPMGFNVGNRIRRFKRRILTRGPRIPRIAVKAIDTEPRIGTRITVRPFEGDDLAIHPIDQSPFLVESSLLKPFAVEPVMVDPDVVGSIFGGFEIDVSEATDWRQAGVVLGSVSGDAATGDLVVRPSEDFPILVEPLNQTPFVVKLPAGERLAFEATEPRLVDVPGAATDPVVEVDEALRLEYVDFDAELTDVEWSTE
jgi:hypothetical protein